MDEETEYAKYQKNEAACKPSVENLAEQCRSQNFPDNAPASLEAACGELQRLLPLLK